MSETELIKAQKEIQRLEYLLQMTEGHKERLEKRIVNLMLVLDKTADVLFESGHCMSSYQGAVEDFHARKLGDTITKFREAGKLASAAIRMEKALAASEI